RADGRAGRGRGAVRESALDGRARACAPVRGARGGAPPARARALRPIRHHAALRDVVSAAGSAALQGALGGPMPNPYIPRDLVHAWSDAIGENPDSAPLQRLLKQQRRLARWIEENAANLEPQSAG